MTERTDLVTAGGNPVTLVGDVLQVGDRAPDCVGINNDMNPVQLSTFRGKAVVLSFVPSLDTSVCSIETMKFNGAASELGEAVAVITVSMDLPFAQKRWCAAEGADRVVTLSDYKERCMGQHYGVLMKESGLLARSIFVIDQKGIIQSIQYVSEVSTEPDYEAVLSSVKELI